MKVNDRESADREGIIASVVILMSFVVVSSVVAWHITHPDRTTLAEQTNCTCVCP